MRSVHFTFFLSKGMPHAHEQGNANWQFLQEFAEVQGRHTGLQRRCNSIACKPYGLGPAYEWGSQKMHCLLASAQVREVNALYALLRW